MQLSLVAVYTFLYSATTKNPNHAGENPQGKPHVKWAASYLSLLSPNKMWLLLMF